MNEFISQHRLATSLNAFFLGVVILFCLNVDTVQAAPVITEYSVGITVGAGPFGITAGPDGNLWFTENGGNRIGKITPSGVVTEYSITGGASPQGITAGPDGNLWFTERGGNRDRQDHRLYASHTTC